ncbi:MerR family transcriptional regulator [Allostreptomyces psammosilenae]|uniref:DNA-binding transcriptional MerR regulator n=1 Tax=Allostreptomyces psammosilenae TaxID=1892865 RepID=A0A852ZRL5_9ACTN|nr:MerR family transcriptional regulator [Allostreptomyces psammosilenae]NYI04117.1 DNA-binding transcriptional MerR regulator [Allostreptomyces psammosilenae]
MNSHSHLTIGDLADRTRLTRKALRLYGDRGLLLPHRVDPRTGVRYYTPEHVERARRIALLRALDVPLSRIGALLDLDGARASAELADYWSGRESRHAAHRRLVAHVRAVLEGRGAPEAGAGWEHVLLERDVAEQMVVSIQSHTDAAGLATTLRESSEALFAHLTAAGAPLSGPVLTLYHGLVSEDSEGPVEVCAPTTGPVQPAGRIAVRFEPAHREVYVRVAKRDCAYPSMVAVHDAVSAALAERGLRPGGPAREVTYPNWATAAPDEHVADVAYPYRPGTAPEPGGTTEHVTAPAG